MRIPSLYSVLYFLFAAGLPALAASSSVDAPHVRVELMVLSQGLNREDAADAGLYFKIESGWHVYWKNAGDAGLPPRVQWTLPEGVAAGALQFPAPKRLPLGPLMDFGYEGEVLFPLKLNVAKTAKSGLALLHANVNWLVCQSSCVPGRAELEISRDVYDHPVKSNPSASDAAIFKRFIGELPKPLPAGYKVAFQPSPEGFRFFVQTGQKEKGASFFPEDQGMLANAAPQKPTPAPTGLILDLKKDANLAGNPAQLNGVLELSGGRAFSVAALPGSIAMSGGNAPSAPAASAPSAPADSAASSSAQVEEKEPPQPDQAPPPAPLETSQLLKTFGLAFLGGMILNLMPCVFPVLFLKGLALVNSGNEERHRLRAHGFVYTAGILVSFWVLVAVLLALRAAGASLGWGFQFQSPIFLALMAGLLFFLGLSLAGQFEIGLTLTSAGGSLAARQGYTGSFFTGVLAVVVATPCTAPFMGAAIGYALAQQAVVTFAVFTALALGLAAPYVAITFQPAWMRLLPRPGAWMDVFKQVISVPIFATVIWLAWVLAQTYGANVLATLLASFLLLAIAGWFLGRWPAKRWSVAVASLILIGVIVVSVVAPDKLIVASEAPTSAITHGRWEPWSAETLSRYQSQGRPVFVDFTASWCLSCQVNERVALNQPEVQKAFREANVALLRADWTQRHQAITEALNALGRSGVPAYALYAPGKSSPQMLPEVLTPGIITDALAKLPKTTVSDVSPSPEVAKRGFVPLFVE
ncbi:MAG: thioredoxin family protein [Formivibrio sp.]|nr:thioredoxin family protein [Formivibrio sp.]